MKDIIDDEVDLWVELSEPFPDEDEKDKKRTASINSEKMDRPKRTPDKLSDLKGTKK